MDIHQQLKDLDFTQLECFDPEYFKNRHRSGFVLLLNEKEKLAYYISTINMYEFVLTAYKVIVGEQRAREKDLHEILSVSQLIDWAVYYRNNGLYPGLRDTIKGLIKEYKSLNTTRKRTDPSQSTWTYHVLHKESGRLFVVIGGDRLVDEEVISAFLRKWRRSLDDSLKRRNLTLSAYYLGCGKIAVATKQWLKGSVEKFEIIELQTMSGVKREVAVDHARFENTKLTKAYRKTIEA